MLLMVTSRLLFCDAALINSVFRIGERLICEFQQHAQHKTETYRPQADIAPRRAPLPFRRLGQPCILNILLRGINAFEFQVPMAIVRAS
jgi:hypothetical protein